MRSILYFCLSLLFFVDITLAAVYNPLILVPNNLTVWTAGAYEVVVWDTSVYSPGSEATGMILLGYSPPGQTNEHLYWTLAKNITLINGNATVLLPRTLETRSDYIVIVLGDSGNASNRFKINSPTMAKRRFAR